MQPLKITYPTHFLSVSFFFNDTATTEIYTLSLHDALPISPGQRAEQDQFRPARDLVKQPRQHVTAQHKRSEEHTSELQSPDHLVCRLLLEKKKPKRQQQSDTGRNKHIST